jgi:hypothetical protein
VVTNKNKRREQRAESRGQRAESREQRAELKEQRAESREQRAESREQREQRAESREQRADCRLQIAESRAVVAVTMSKADAYPHGKGPVDRPIAPSRFMRTLHRTGEDCLYLGWQRAGIRRRTGPVEQLGSGRRGVACVCVRTSMFPFVRRVAVASVPKYVDAVWYCAMMCDAVSVRCDAL